CLSLSLSPLPSSSLWKEQTLAGKPAGFFVSTRTQGGGQETIAWTAITQLVHHGMLIVPIVYTFGAGMFKMDSIHGGSCVRWPSIIRDIPLSHPSKAQALSLSQVLRYYLPLTGRLTWSPQDTKPCVTVSKHDTVSLTVAETDADFSFLSGDGLRLATDHRPLVPELKIFDDSATLLSVQVTLFPKQGFCMGIASHHSVNDGATSEMFIKSWDHICRLQQHTINVPSGLESKMVEFVSSGDKFKTLKPTPSELSPDVVRTTVELTWENLEKLRERLTTTSRLVTFTDRHLHTRPRTLAETRSSFIRKGAAKAATNHRTCTKKTETTNTTLSQSGQEAALDQAPETRRPSTRRHRAEQPWLTNPTNRLLARAAVTENPQRIYPVRNRWQLQTSPREKVLCPRVCLRVDLCGESAWRLPEQKQYVLGIQQTLGLGWFQYEARAFLKDDGFVKAVEILSDSVKGLASQGIESLFEDYVEGTKKIKPGEQFGSVAGSTRLGINGTDFGSFSMLGRRDGQVVVWRLECA
ncbi:unnamed protein product, partial [Brassica napus]